MTTDAKFLDQVNRSQASRTRRRRNGRSRRRGVYVLAALGLIALLVLAGPSLLSHSSMGRSFVRGQLAGYGLDATLGEIRMGWVTPLRVKAVNIRGASGDSELTIDMVDVDVTLLDIIRGSSSLGQVTLRDVKLRCSVTDDRSSLEDDLAPVLDAMTSDSDSSSTTTGHIKLLDVVAIVTDAVTGDSWKVSQSSAEIDLLGEATKATFAGVLTEPQGGTGSLQGSVELNASTLGTNSQVTRPDSNAWRLSVQTESLPLSVVSLLRRRFSSSMASAPQIFHGDATGEIVLASGATESAGIIEASLHQFNLRDVAAYDVDPATGQTVLLWRNALASVDGDVVLLPHQLIGKQLIASTDFARATVNGVFSRDFSWVGTSDNPLRWLEGIDGIATAEINLPRLQEALPGVLPIRNEAQLLHGRAMGRVESFPPQQPDAPRLSKVALSSTAVSARSRGSNVDVDPIQLTATVASQNGRVRAERFQWTSEFGKAVGQGDLQSGSADVEVDFGRLVAMLRPIVDMSDASLEGFAKGDIRWNASADQIWRLRGGGNAENLVVTLPSGQRIQRDGVQCDIDAVGRWGNQTLQQLSQAKILLTSNDLSIKAELDEPVANPDGQSPLPVTVSGRGEIAALQTLLSPWLPVEIHDAGGSFEFISQVAMSSAMTSMTYAKVGLEQPRLGYSDRIYSQPKIDATFTGDLQLPSGAMHAERMIVSADAFSAAVMGDMQGDSVDLDVRWRAMLERLQGSVDPKYTAQRRDRQIRNQESVQIKPAGFQRDRNDPATSTSRYLVRGDCEGEMRITRATDWWVIDHQTNGKWCSLRQQEVIDASTMRTRSTNQSASVALWEEPNVQLSGITKINPATGQFVSAPTKFATDWFATTLAGEGNWASLGEPIQLEGPVRMKMDDVALKLSTLAGTTIRAEGIHETTAKLVTQQTAEGGFIFDLQTELGWELGEVGGVTFGASRVPIRVNETKVVITPTNVPVGDGFVRASGTLDYAGDSMWMQLEPGTIAESIVLTPEMTDRWLKYLAPLAARTARINGTISADCEEAIINFDDVASSRIVGRMGIGGVDMNAGPLAGQLIGGINQLASLAGAFGANVKQQNQEATLITMPPQTVNFSLVGGVVTHDRLFFDVDRAQVVTSGRVRIADGRLDMQAMIPLDERWLGKSLKGLAGQTITLPIDGTISKPSLDSTSIAKVAGDVGAKAIQETAENYIEKQLGRGLEKLFGR